MSRFARGSTSSPRAMRKTIWSSSPQKAAPDHLMPMHPFFSSSRPLVFAHRGGSALAPENTITAFDNGLALGSDGLELDVRLSRDGAVVVHHDRTLDRTTNGRGEVAALTSDELARVDAGYYFREAGTYPFRGRGINV